jgi:hypothetical protein
MFRRAALLIAALFLALPAPVAQAWAQTLEYGVKANYLVRFAAFVDWPPSAFESASAPLTICVAGRDPFGELLDLAAEGQIAHGRRIAVRRPATRGALAGCHVLYLGAGSGELAAGASPTLVVSDSVVTAQRGMIHFAVAGGRVRFHIDNRAAKGAGLGISSRLLNLAISVREGG